MFTLHDATDLTKKVIIWGIVSVIGFILLSIVFGIVKGLFKSAPAGPTTTYGKLSSVTFPKSQSSQNYDFKTDTISGDLPSLPDRANVYKIIAPQPTLLALQNAQTNVSQLGYNPTPYRLSESMYEWTDTSTPLHKTLTMDIFTSDATVSSSFLTDPNITSSANFPTTQNDIIDTGDAFLTSLTALPQDVGTKKVTYFQLQNGQLIKPPAQDPSLAQIARVDYFQKDIDKCYPDATGSIKSCSIYYPIPDRAFTEVVVSGGEQQAQIVEAHLYHRTIDTSDTTVTYPLKAAKEALSDLQNGKGYVASYYGTTTTIEISSIKLGYYLGENQNYLLPIVVFEGKDGFIGYTPAITDAWIQK